MAKERKSYIPIAFALLAVALFVAIFTGMLSQKSGLLTYQEAKEILMNDILASDAEKEGITAYLYEAMLSPGDIVGSWDADADNNTIGKETWFAWIDRKPEAVFFEHDTQFVYIDANTGEYTLVDQQFWPVINEEPFEGLDEEMLSYNGDVDEETINLLNKKKEETIQNYVGDFIILNYDAEAGRFMHIDITQMNSKEPHKHRAVIISGFGRNNWAFLEGTKLMYERLREMGFNDTQINYRATGPAALDPSWNREGSPGFVYNGNVDGSTSKKNILATFASLKEEMTHVDSLFVFVLAHGKKGKIMLGRPFSQREEMGTDSPLNGKPDPIRATEFAKAVMDINLCELMIVFDSCYSGTQEKPLRDNYDPNKIKRVAVAHSTNDKTVSWGADFKQPGKNPVADFDYPAKLTPKGDPNPGDHGGEFSSGFIENMGSGVFALAFKSAVANDAASLNGRTFPYMWTLGENGPCLPTNNTSVTDGSGNGTDGIGNTTNDTKTAHIGGFETGFEHFTGYSFANAWITVLDSGNEPVPGAIVIATVERPDATTAIEVGTSDTDGTALLSHETTLYGTYTFTVTDITGENIVYNPAEDVASTGSVLLS